MVAAARSSCELYAARDSNGRPPLLPGFTDGSLGQIALRWAHCLASSVGRLGLCGVEMEDLPRWWGRRWRRHRRSDRPIGRWLWSGSRWSRRSGSWRSSRRSESIGIARAGGGEGRVEAKDLRCHSDGPEQIEGSRQLVTIGVMVGRKQLRATTLARPRHHGSPGVGSRQSLAYPPETQPCERQRENDEERRLVDLERPVAASRLVRHHFVELGCDVSDAGLHAP